MVYIKKGNKNSKHHLEIIFLQFTIICALEVTCVYCVYMAEILYDDVLLH